MLTSHLRSLMTLVVVLSVAIASPVDKRAGVIESYPNVELSIHYDTVPPGDGGVCARPAPGFPQPYGKNWNDVNASGGTTTACGYTGLDRNAHYIAFDASVFKDHLVKLFKANGEEVKLDGKPFIYGEKCMECLGGYRLDVSGEWTRLVEERLTRIFAWIRPARGRIVTEADGQVPLLMQVDKDVCQKGHIGGFSAKVMDNMAIKDGEYGIKLKDGTIGGRCKPAEPKTGCKDGLTYLCQSTGMEGSTYIWSWVSVGGACAKDAIQI